MKLAFEVRGIPGAQGSKKGFVVKKDGEPTGKVVMVESSAKVKPWRQDVKAAAESALLDSDEWEVDWRGPVSLWIVFTFTRPASHYGTGRNAGALKASAPGWPIGRNTGDIDKLQRSTLDALTAAGVFHDDSQVFAADVVKMWGAGGARIQVTSR
jgi:Holliday junction resolvase RusA-like endonuclease